MMLQPMMAGCVDMLQPMMPGCVDLVACGCIRLKLVACRNVVLICGCEHAADPCRTRLEVVHGVEALDACMNVMVGRACRTGCMLRWHSVCSA